MARGFGFTEGSGSGDRVVTSFTAHAQQRSYGIWIKPTSGGDSVKRVFEKRGDGDQVELVIYNIFQNRIEFERQWTLQRGRWSIPTFPNDVWTHLGISYDFGSAANDAVFYANGVTQSVTTLDAPSGLPVSNTDPFVIGNRGDGTRTIGAHLAEFAIWDRLLSQGEWAALGKGFSPLAFPHLLRCYVPLLREPADYFRHGSVDVGTIPRNHPRIIQSG
jgi:hypothetical protein